MGYSGQVIRVIRVIRATGVIEVIRVIRDLGYILRFTRVIWVLNRHIPLPVPSPPEAPTFVLLAPVPDD
jgi:hypothetical protein